MGFPLSQFQQLARLCNGEYKQGMSCFDDYNLVAIVLHSHSDVNLKSELEREFEWLDHVSGSKLAFISFVSPSEHWISENMNRMICGEQIICDSSGDDEMFLNQLAFRFGVQELPAVVVTNSLASNEYVVFKTSADLISFHLERLSRYAFGLEKNDPDWYKNIPLLNIDERSYCFRTDNGKSLASNIADLLSVQAMVGNGINQNCFVGTVKKEANKWAKNVLTELRKGIDSTDKTTRDNALKHYTFFYSYIISVCEKRYRRNSDVRGGQYRHLLNLRSFDKCTEYTKQEALSFNILLGVALDWCGEIRRYYRDCAWITEDMENSALDKSLCAALGRLVESEINASLVQLMRKAVGVAMPDFWFKFDSTKKRGKCKVLFSEGNRNNRDSVDLNFFDRNLNRLRPVTLGQIKPTLEALFNSFPDFRQEAGMFGSDDFLKYIEWLSSDRNFAAHFGDFVRNFLDEELPKFNKFLDTYLEQMISLKQCLLASSGRMVE